MRLPMPISLRSSFPRLKAQREIPVQLERLGLKDQKVIKVIQDLRAIQEQPVQMAKMVHQQPTVGMGLF